MRVLWVCNVPLSIISQHRGGVKNPIGGWLDGLSNGLLQSRQVELGVCFPLPGTASVETGQTGGLTYFGFSSDLKKLSQYDPRVERQMGEILAQFNPDLVHIFGTEYPHSLAMIRAFQKPERTFIHIQGLVSIYAIHFMANLPNSVQNKFTFRDLIRWDNLKLQQKKFYRRGIFEKEALRCVRHIIGRTDWDQALSGFMSPKARYHFCNETLRDIFYQKEWRLDQCERYSIFLSQGSYPIKGLHYMLEAMPFILRRFPQAKLYVAGQDIAKTQNIKDKLKQSSYGQYIGKLIDRYHLWKAVHFTGFLDETEMCGRFLKSHVFVSPSSIENSPNSVGEAMLLGVPVVASDVGGVKDLLEHKKEGYVYPCDAPYLLAYYVCRIFESDNRALSFSKQARIRASKTHDREANTKRMLEIYGGVYESL